MALNAGGGIGISLFVKADGLAPEIDKSIKRLKTFTDTFNDVLNTMKPVTSETQSLIQELENMSQFKYNEVLKGATGGSMDRNTIERNRLAMQALNDAFRDNVALFNEMGDTQAFNESLSQLTQIWKLATKEGIDFKNAVTLLREAETPEVFDEARYAIERLNPTWDKFAKKVSKSFDDFVHHRVGVNDLLGSIVDFSDKAIMDKLGQSTSKLTVYFGILAYKIGSGAFKTSLNFVTTIFKTWITLFVDIGIGIFKLAGSIASKLIPSFHNIGETATWLKDRIIGLADSFIKVTLGGLNLTTNLEARLTQMDKQATAIGANFGKTGGDLRKFSGQASSMALALNMGINETTDALKAWSRAGTEFKAIGLTSASEVAKMANVTGVNADKMGEQLRKLNTYFKFQKNDLDVLVGTWVKFGQESGNVGFALDQLPNTIEAIQKRAALLGQTMDGKQAAGYATQIASLSRMFYGLGETQEKAAAAAQDIAMKMVESRKSFQNMFAGTEGQFSDALKGIGIASKDIKVALNSMKQGPAEFIGTLSKMRDASGKAINLSAEQFNFIRGHLETAFGETTPLILRAFAETDDKVLGLLESTAKASEGLKKLTKEGFKTGYTLAERFQLVSDKFEMAFRTHGKKDAEAFVAAAGPAFSQINAKVSELVKEGGPLGGLLQKMSEVHSLGALAFIPQTLRPMAAGFGTLAKAMMPTVEALGAFGISISDLFSPLGLFTTAVAGLGTWFASLYVSSGSVSKSLNKMMDDTAEFFESIPEYIDNFVQWIDNLFTEIDAGIDDGINGVDWSKKWTRLMDAASKALSAIWNVIQKVAQGVWDGLGKGFDPNQSTGKSGLEKIGNYIGLAMRKAWDWAVNFIKTEVWPRIMSFGRGVFDAMKSSVDPAMAGRDGAYSLGTSIGDSLLWVWNEVVVPGAAMLWNAIGDFFSGFWSGLWNGVNADNGDQSFANDLGSMVGDAIGSAFEVAWQTINKIVAENKTYTFLLAVMAGGVAAGAVGALAGAVFAGLFAVYATNENQKNLADNMAAQAAKTLGLAEDKLKDAIPQTKKKVSKMLQDVFAAEDANQLGAGFQGVMGGPLQNAELVMNQAAKLSNKYAKTTATVNDAILSYNKAVDGMRERFGEALQEAQETYDTYGKEEDKIRLDNLAKQAAETELYLANVDELVAGLQATGKSKAESLNIVLESINLGQVHILGNMLSKAHKDLMQNTLKDLNQAGEQSKDIAKETGKGTAEAFHQGIEEGVKASGKPSIADEFVGPVQTPKKVKPESFIEGMSEDDKKKMMRDPSLKKTFAEMAKNLDAPVKKTIEEVLSMAFENAYKKIDTGTKKFTGSLIDKFKEFVKNITDIITTMWNTIDTKMSSVISTLSGQMETITRNLRDLMGAVEAVNLGQGTVNELKEQNMPQRRKLEEGASKDDQMFDAIHNPDWFFGETGYRVLFKAEMAALRSEIRNMGIPISPAAPTQGKKSSFDQGVVVPSMRP